MKGGIYAIEKATQTLQTLSLEELSTQARMSKSWVLKTIHALELEPCRKVPLPNGRVRYFYDLNVLVNVKTKIEQLVSQRGKWLCAGGCGDYYDKTELTSCMCTNCHAHKTALNFSKRGRYQNSVSLLRLHALYDACNNLLNKYTVNLG